MSKQESVQSFRNKWVTKLQIKLEFDQTVPFPTSGKRWTESKTKGGGKRSCNARSKVAIDRIAGCGNEKLIMDLHFVVSIRTFSGFFHGQSIHRMETTEAGCKLIQRILGSIQTRRDQCPICL
ncbi:hypothetical protein C4D60_Mb04t33810 [Musa balbisiana]|uniref:Uncharacterized protein n=1 Tax=Musa balbisiana TaxID=52838 RepID=A0A4S8KH57_MUSBA|nr:hypothetical protein C4D60_Mb04t33810 [Musa balbisiana]